MPGGLPHSEIPGSPIARISPGLFAACCVLHRLSVPRHPPDALLIALDCLPRRPRPGAKPPKRQRPHMKTLPGQAPNSRRACPPRSHDKLSLHPSNNKRCGRPATPSRRPNAGGASGGGGERIRTDDLLLAKQALSQLSYTPCARDQKTELRDPLCSEL